MYFAALMEAPLLGTPRAPSSVSAHCGKQETTERDCIRSGITCHKLVYDSLTCTTSSQLVRICDSVVANTAALKCRISS